ncbi:MAG: hypothetical protein CMJ84_15420 [Planctomycetes bacterium]|nr:hypothetical protein [Planctomycetota bacterium]
MLGGAVLLAAAGSGQAQGEVWFEVLEDLEDYQVHQLSEYSTLYDFTPFDSRSKSFVSGEELRELRAAWALEIERVALEIERVEASPEARETFRVKHRIDKNAYFADIDKRWVEGFGRFHVLVQRPPKDDEAHYSRTATFCAEWAEALHAVFLSEYVEPLELQARPAHTQFMIAVLASEGAYKDYALRNKTVMLPGMRAHYDPRMRLAVTYDPWAGGARSKDDVRQALMHELIHAFQHAYSTTRDLPPHPWVNEGLAEYLSSGTSGKPEDLRERLLEPRARKMVADALKHPLARELYVLPLADMLAAESYRDVMVAGFRRSQSAASGARFPYSRETALSLFYRQAYLLVYFLHREAGGRHRPAFAAYLKSTLRGKGDLAAFETAFEGVDLARLEGDFLNWIEPSVREWRPKPTTVESRSVEAAARAGEGAAGAEYDLETVRPDTGDVDNALSLAVWHVVQGLPEEARGLLEEVASGLAENDGRLGRLAQEIERVRAWITLRNQFLAWLEDEGRRLSIRSDGRILRAPVREVRGGRVLLGKNSAGLESVRIADLNLDLMVRDMIKARGFEFSWARLYVDMLIGREKWDSKLPKNDPSAESLRAHAPEYPERIAEGERIARLGALADAPPPENPASARALIDEMAALLADRGRSRVVARSVAGMRPLARLCAESVSAHLPLPEMLAGRVRELGDGRVRVRYEWQSQDELRDFAPFDRLPGIASSAASPSVHVPSVGAGVLRFGGQRGFRHRLRLEGPMSASYTVRYPQGGAPLYSALGVGEADAGKIVLCSTIGSLIVMDARGAGARRIDDAGGIELKRAYSLELTLDGRAASVARDGETVATLDAASHTGGELFLWFDTGPQVEFGELCIEGTMHPDSLSAIRDHHAEHLLAELFGE